jgi:hypothetical protein
MLHLYDLFGDSGYTSALISSVMVLRISVECLVKPHNIHPQAICTYEYSKSVSIATVKTAGSKSGSMSHQQNVVI